MIPIFLFSTHYRTWDDAAQNHMDVIKQVCGEDSIDSCILGIHIWDVEGVPNEPPQLLRECPYIMTKTVQTPQRNIFEYILVSTRIALENANELYKKRYGTEIPDDATIIRLRPDTWVGNIQSTITHDKLQNLDNTYLSIWNTKHRSFIPRALEVADTIYFTTYKVLHKLVNTPFEDFDPYFDKKRHEGYDFHFHEHLLYHALEMIGARVVNDHSLELGLYRANGYIDKLTQ